METWNNSRKSYWEKVAFSVNCCFSYSVWAKIVSTNSEYTHLEMFSSRSSVYFVFEFRTAVWYMYMIVFAIYISGEWHVLVHSTEGSWYWLGTCFLIPERLTNYCFSFRRTLINIIFLSCMFLLNTCLFCILMFELNHMVWNQPRSLHNIGVIAFTSMLHHVGW